MKTSFRRLLVSSLAVTALSMGLAGCGTGNPSTKDGADGQLTLWTHNAGNAMELNAVQETVDAFNASQDDVRINVQAFPQDSYNDSVVAAASASKLPCLVDIDGPNVPNWAWAQYLRPLELSTDLSKHLPSTLGQWNGTTYAVGAYDVALAFIARKSDLAAANIRVATIDQPWSKEEFDTALASLKALGTRAYPLDMGTSGTREWPSYAFSPLLQSFGGDLLSREGAPTANGFLNSAAAVEWGTWFHGLVEQGFMAQKSGKDSTLDFLNEKSAILYTGSWTIDTVRAELGDDLAVMPSVDLGNGAKIGGGSWQWGVSTGCANPEAAMDYLDFSMKPENIAKMAKATGTIPATEAAAALVPGYGPGEDRRLLMEFSKRFAVLRPETPAYAFISSEFEKASADILAGATPQKALNRAVKNIDANIKSNNGYTN